jgi:hypothetical protein
MKIEAFDKPILKAMRQEIDAALAQVGQKFGVTFQGGNIRYSADSFRMQITAAIIGEGGKVEPVEAKDFKKYCGIYGMVPADLGRHFYSNGETYELVGYKPKGQKYLFIGKRQDGKRFKFTLESVRRGLGIK